MARHAAERTALAVIMVAAAGLVAGCPRADTSGSAPTLVLPSVSAAASTASGDTPAAKPETPLGAECPIATATASLAGSFVTVKGTTAGIDASVSAASKELCIAVLVTGNASPLSVPFRMAVSGGRVSPATLVIPCGQTLHYQNQDTVPHALFAVGAHDHGFSPMEILPVHTRTWTPRRRGKYEIRDELAPGLRSWIVVEPRALTSVAYPGPAGDFQIDLRPGTYTLRAYLRGEPVGVELPVTVQPAPDEQTLRAPLVVAGSRGR